MNERAKGTEYFVRNLIINIVMYFSYNSLSRTRDINSLTESGI